MAQIRQGRKCATTCHGVKQECFQSISESGQRYVSLIYDYYESFLAFSGHTFAVEADLFD